MGKRASSKGHPWPVLLSVAWPQATRRLARYMKEHSNTSVENQSNSSRVLSEAEMQTTFQNLRSLSSKDDRKERIRCIARSCLATLPISIPSRVQLMQDFLNNIICYPLFHQKNKAMYLTTCCKKSESNYFYRIGHLLGPTWWDICLGSEYTIEMPKVRSKILLLVFQCSDNL